ncbi:MAG: HlyD family efflux transporter periplasmic adaptor subunit [Myxococcales bacterium]|nr:HlyD family efflux transporter periplasmic adaptor subunit [Myxococcales bacterium]
MKRRVRNGLSAAIWLAALVGVLVLWRRATPDHAPLSAEVLAPTHQVGPAEAGRIVEVMVQPGDAVRAGQVLARLDTLDLDAETAIARAELATLAAQVAAETAALQAEVSKNRLDTQSRLAEAQATLADARAEQAARKAELETLSNQLGRLEAVLRDGLAEVDRVTALRARQRALTEEAALRPQTMRAWRRLGDRMNDALSAIDDGAIGVRIRPLQSAVETQQRRIEALAARRARRTLRAPVDGHVEAVRHQAGDPVPAGAPIVTVVSSGRPLVRAYLNATLLRGVQPGRAVQVRSADHGVTTEGVVERLGPAMVELPARLWPRPDAPRYGRPIYVRLTGDTTLLPGEVAEVTLLDVDAGGAQAAPAAGPARLDVPAALGAISRFEPSGAVWLPERGRFLVVSDDTGLKGPTEHQPMVFLIDPAGRVDPTPLPIEGVGRLSDLEAVTRDPDGALWLLCSQSRSKKGKRSAKRQRLVRATLDGDRLRASGSVALFDALTASLDASAQAALGLGDALDVEGMAWFDGGLLLGLKAPSTPDGRARLWRVHGPALVFEHGFGPTGARIEPFGAVRLPTGPKGAPGGVSDLVVDGDGLLLLSTLAEGPDASAAWRVTLPLGGAPQRLASWPDLKAEALARGPDGWTVFFDSEPPRWAPLR